MALSQWLYISDVVDSLSLDDLLKIQDGAIRNNARGNITGLLLRCEGRLVQFLEGEYTQADEWCALLMEDERHANVKLLYVRPAFQRYFERWHMAMLDLDLHGEAERANFREMVQAASNRAIGPDNRPADLAILDRFVALLDEWPVASYKL